MIIATLQIDNYHIEVHNSIWTGIERIYANGQLVSKQFNWFYGVHTFSLPALDGYSSDDYRVEFHIDFWKMSMVSTDVFRNGVCVLDQTGKGTRRSHRYNSLPPARPQRQDTLELRQLERTPLYREEDLV